MIDQTIPTLPLASRSGVCVVSGAVFCVFVALVFSEPDWTALPLLGSWIGSHPHRFVRIVRCVVDRDTEERRDLFPGTISRGIGAPYVKLVSP